MQKRQISRRVKPLKKPRIQTQSEFSSEKSEINIRISFAPLESLIKPAKKILSNILRKSR